MCCEKLFSTLKNPVLTNTCRSLIKTCRYEWSEIKKNLINRFCRRSILKEQFNSKLASLKFSTYANIENFLTLADEIFHLLQSVYPDDLSQKRFLVSAVVNKLPSRLIHDVVTDIKKLSHGNEDDWETILDWDTFGDYWSVREVIRSCSRTFEISEKSTKPFEKSQSHRQDDFVKEVRENSLDNWAAQFAAVLVIRGDKCDSNFEHVKTFLEEGSDELKPMTGKMDGKKYFMVAFKDKSASERISKKAVEENLTCRPYRPFGSGGKGKGRFKGFRRGH
jgi:hypothetical protein